jgi:hypothetical protein
MLSHDFIIKKKIVDWWITNVAAAYLYLVSLKASANFFSFSYTVKFFLLT